MSRRLRPPLALLVALVLLLLAPVAAHAHAILEGSTPKRGEALASAPAEVVFRFSEPVEASFGAVKVFDGEGRRVDRGDPFRPGGRSSEIAVRLAGDLPDGGYTATYRVISADSHPVSGGFVFAVGDGAAGGSKSVSELLDGSQSGPVTSVALGVGRGLQYLAIALGAGGLLFLLLAWLPALRSLAGGSAPWADASAAFDARLRRLFVVAAALGAVSGAFAIVSQGATAGGTSVWDALSPSVIGDVLGTRFGVVWGLGVLAWLLVLGLVAVRAVRIPTLRPASVGATGLAMPGARRPGLIALGVLLAALCLLPGLGGHAGVQAPVWLLMPANTLHVVAMAMWVGGVVVLLFVLRGATQRLEGADRTRLLAGVVARFSTLALVAVATVLATGVAQSLVHVRTFDNLVDTPFGRSVLIKFGLFLLLVALGAVNQRRLVPALKRAAEDPSASPGRTGVLLRRTLRAEGALMLGVLGATAALAAYAPSIAESAGPFSTAKTLGPARLEVTVDPATVGANEMHVYLFDRTSGAQYDETKELTVTAELPSKNIGQLELAPRKSGPGHYVIEGGDFGVAGDWKVSVVARVSEFDQFETTFTVPVSK